MVYGLIIGDKDPVRGNYPDFNLSGTGVQDVIFYDSRLQETQPIIQSLNITQLPTFIFAEEIEPGNYKTIVRFSGNWTNQQLRDVLKDITKYQAIGDETVFESEQSFGLGFGNLSTKNKVLLIGAAILLLSLLNDD